MSIKLAPFASTTASPQIVRHPATEATTRTSVAPAVIATSDADTHTGPVTTTTTVYDDGSVITTESDALTMCFSVVRKTVSLAAVQGLRDDLLTFGEMRQCDQPPLAADLSMTTLTVFSECPGAVAHSFSYFLPSGEVQEFENFLNEIESREAS